MLNKKQKLIVILGPTASGKSDLAFKLAKKFNGEIVSADSRQIYKYMDIGTAKPGTTADLRRTKRRKTLITKGIPHYMIDIIKPDEEFTVAQYKKKAIEIIKDIQKRGKIPFLVGGTGLYISAIVDNLQIPQVPPYKVLRKKLEGKSTKQLLRQLEKLDPDAASHIDPHNKRRLIRALEVCLITGKPFSLQRKKGKPLFDVLQIGVRLPRKVLYKKIDQRVDKMIKKGLVKEVRKLYKRGYEENLPSMSGIGYRQIGMHLRKLKAQNSKLKIDLKEAICLIKRDTRRYARRQMTWFKRDKRVKWVKSYLRAEKLIKGFLKKNC